MQFNVNISTKIQLFIIVWYIFLSQFAMFSVTQYSALIKIIVLILIPCINFINIKNKKIKLIDCLWLFAISVYGIQAFASTDVSKGLYEVIKLGVFYILFLFLSSSADWQKKIMELLFIFSGIHVVCTILQFLIPDMMNLVISKLLSAESYSMTLKLFSYGSYAGIAEQTGFNSMFISVFIVILSSKILIAKEEKMKNGILLIIGIVAIFLSAKRSPLIAIFVAEVFSIFLILRNPKKIMQKVLPILTIVLLVYYITLNTPALQVVFERFKDNENFTSNRDVIYEFMFENFKENPFFGKGTGSLSTALSISGHNIYLQMLYENGIFGTVPIIGIFSTALIYTRKLLKNSVKDTRNEIDIYYCLLASYMFQIFFLFYGLTESVFYNPTMFATYVVMIAIPFSFYNKKLN